MYGHATRFIELAGEINTSMPEHVVRKVAEALNGVRKPLNGSKVLLIGLAYKANVDDMRESPTFILMDLLKNAGSSVDYYDPYVPVISPTREHAQWTGKRSIEWNATKVSSYDLVLISTAHACIDFQQLADWSKVIVDTRNALKGIETNSIVTKA